ncbi:hypothetical protein M231_07040 [Tremella mesenterica]|uniref:Uncharacterized protein n=1 Tax=Tremella mesenterica TaxID=5217 RepID=A0A4Q1BAB3_TREME|nr:hypothetical protein M231_07040 [Tremella mesenterica]
MSEIPGLASEGELLEPGASLSRTYDAQAIHGWKQTVRRIHALNDLRFETQRLPPLADSAPLRGNERSSRWPTNNPYLPDISRSSHIGNSVTREVRVPMEFKEDLTSHQPPNLSHLKTRSEIDFEAIYPYSGPPPTTWSAFDLPRQPSLAPESFGVAWPWLLSQLS